MHLGLSTRAAQVAHDDERVFERGERLQRRRELELCAGGRWRPGGHVRAMRDVDEADSRRPDARGLGQCGRGRQHRIEQRQRNGRADTAKERPSW